MTRDKMKELADVAKAYCDKMGYELLFVNEYKFGFETKNGELYTLTWSGLADKLTGNE